MVGIRRVLQKALLNQTYRKEIHFQLNHLDHQLTTSCPLPFSNSPYSSHLFCARWVEDGGVLIYLRFPFSITKINKPVGSSLAAASIACVPAHLGSERS